MPLGTARLHLTRNRTSGRIIGVHMLFIPAVDYLAQLKGISARSMKFPRDRNSVGRSLTTFRVLRDDSLVFKFIQTGNIAGIRNLLGTRQVHPTDRDTDGDSLLYVRSSLLFKDIISSAFRSSRLLHGQYGRLCGPRILFKPSGWILL